MSLYNQLFETDPIASFLMHDILGIRRRDVARWRDCYLNEDGSRVVILTRTGGYQREEYQKANEALAQHPCYVSDEDAMDTDTYGYFYFEPPEQHRAALKDMSKEHGRKPAIERMMDLLKKIDDPSCKSDPDVLRAMEVGRRVVEQIQGAIELQDATSDMDDPPGIHVIEM